MDARHSLACLLQNRSPFVSAHLYRNPIAVALERMQPSRPLTHDLMKNFMSAFNVELQEIIINDLQEGIFYSKLVCYSEHDTVDIDSRTSDALALAVRFGCPIYTYENILESAGILMDDATSSKKKNVEAVGVEDPSAPAENNLSGMTIEELQTLLNDVLEHEDYIRAIAIRDEINKRKTRG